MPPIRRYHEITEERKPEFVARGYKGRHFFPHRCYVLPRALPEQVRVGARAWGIGDHDALFSLLLYADQQWAGRFPQDLFFDRQVMIHREHHGLTGLTATAHLYIDGDRLCTDEHQSDLVQRIHLRREHKSQVEKRFGTWHHMLLNSILNFAVMKGLREIHLPNARRVMNSYIGKAVNPELFVRLYDNNINRHFDAKQQGDTWVIDVQQHRDKLVPLEPRDEPVDEPRPAVCIVHDLAEQTPAAAKVLERVLAIEQVGHVQATYNLPVSMMKAHQQRLEAAGHAVGFMGHTAGPYRCRQTPAHEESAPMATLTRGVRTADYFLRKALRIKPGRVPTTTVMRSALINRLRRCVGIPAVLYPLSDCRRADYYLKGYRQTTHDRDAGLSDEQLRHHHFEWLLTEGSGEDTGFADKRGLLKFPVIPMPGDEPTHAIEQALERGSVVALSLPISGQPGWLEAYAQRLEQMQGMAEIRTIQSVVDRYHLSRAI